jgi:hypothetical protein
MSITAQQRAELEAMLRAQRDQERRQWRSQTRAEREAIKAALEAEERRQARNEYARERRAPKKAADLRERELSKLIAALGMLGSAHAGERAAAALQVERLRAKIGKTWPELIR